MTSRQPPRIACDLTVLDETQRARRAQLEDWLREGTVSVEELPGGHAFHLDPTSHVARHLDELVALERQCCPFFELDVQPARGERGPVLTISGGEEVKRFVAAQFGPRSGDDQTGCP